MATAIPDNFLAPGVAFDSLPVAAFAGFIFPVSRAVVKGALRDHVHEYPHSPGGAPEKLGRKLYEFEFECPFYQGFARYPSLWPETLASLRIIFEGGRSFDLQVPTVGTITAYCTSWEETADPKVGRNGVTVRLTFREDQSDLFLVTNLVAATSQGFAATVSAFSSALDDQEGRLPAALAAGVASPDALLAAPLGPSALAAFGAVLNAATGVLGALGSVESFGLTLAALAEGLVTLCQAADDLDDGTWDDPTREPLLYALHDLWYAAQQLRQDALQVGVEVVDFVVPQPGLGVGAISTAIYGDASHAIDVLVMNPQVTDPFWVPGGTQLRCYLFAVQGQGAT